MSGPLVSVLMPVYNSSDFARSEGKGLLRLAIQSLLAQSYRNIELVILDNQSTDDTPAVCKAFAAADDRVRYVVDSEKRFIEGGISQAAGLARGELCMIGNDDDLWDREYVEAAVAQLEANRDLHCVYTGGHAIDVDGERLWPLINPGLVSYETLGRGLPSFATYLLRRDVIPIAFGVFRRDFYLQTLPFEKFDALTWNIDNLFMAKFFWRGGRAGHVDRPLFNYRHKQRHLNPKAVPGMSSLDKPLSIWAFLVRHQFRFLEELNALMETPGVGARDAEIGVALAAHATVDSCFRQLTMIKKAYCEAIGDTVRYLQVVRAWMKRSEALRVPRFMQGTLDRPDLLARRLAEEPHAARELAGHAARELRVFGETLAELRPLLFDALQPGTLPAIEASLAAELALLEGGSQAALPRARLSLAADATLVPGWPTEGFAAHSARALLGHLRRKVAQRETRGAA